MSEQQVKLFLTREHECSYRKSERANTLFVDPQLAVDQQVYSELNQLGFRRSGQHFYKPHCSTCKACIPSRIDVAAFVPNRSQRRIVKKNRDLERIVRDDIAASEEHYDVYQRYIEQRHRDGDMYPPSYDQFEQFILSASANTLFIEYRLDKQLLATSVVDPLIDGLSAIYTYFDPDYSDRSPGAFSILANIELTQSQRLPYLYLGYWIEDCAKMNYKTDYRPVELLIDQHWQVLV